MGVDFNAPEGTPILSTAGGVVTYAGMLNSSAGYTVVVDHGGGWSSTYMHVKPEGFLVEKGDRVATGQAIALVGQTGNAQGPHLHFQIQQKGKAYDPLHFGITGRLTPSQQDRPVSTSPVYGRKPPRNRRELAQQLIIASIDTVSRSIAGGERTYPIREGSSIQSLEADGMLSDPGEGEVGLVSPTEEERTTEEVKQVLARAGEGAPEEVV